MGNEQTAKICAVCGEDCSNKPRTKDNKGRYYCTPCYQRVTAKPHANGGAAHGNRSIAYAEPDAGFMLDQLIASAPPPAHMTACPQCGHARPADTVLCVNCGYNAQTHHSVGRPKVVRAQRPATGGVIWPWIVGITSMVLGACGVLFYGFFFVIAVLTAFQPDAFLPSIVSTIPATCLVTSLSVWLLRDGWRIVQRNSDGMKWIRYWALTKILLFGILLTLIANMPTRPLDDALAQEGFDDISGVAARVKAAMLLILLWVLAWPAFVLVFSFVPRIQKDVEMWDDRRRY